MQTAECLDHSLVESPSPFQNHGKKEISHPPSLPERNAIKLQSESGPWHPRTSASPEEGVPPHSNITCVSPQPN